jgi:ComEC/Rec2-related protein
MSLHAASPAGRWVTMVGGGFAAGSGAGFAGSASPMLVVPGTLAVIGLSIMAAGFRRQLALPIAVVGGAIVLGLLRGALAVVIAGPGTIEGNLGLGAVVLTGVVRSADPGTGSDAIVDVSHLSDSDADRAVSGGVLVSGPLIPALAPGDRVEIDASGLRPLSRRPGALSEDTLEREGVQGIATAPQVFVVEAGGPSVGRASDWAQAQLIAAVNRELPEPAAALVLGIAFGVHQPLSADVRTPLQDAGLIHIVVVSGLKVVLVIGVLSAVASELQWSRRQTLLLILPTVVAYVVVSGAGPAAVRSAIMAGTALMARSSGRRSDPIPMLAAVAALMLGVSPELAGDPGFELSFLGTAGILLLAGPIAARLPGPRLFIEPFAVTVAAQVATIPVMASTFGVIALGGPIANALVLPFLPIMIATGGAGAILSAVHPGLGWLLLQVTALGAAAIAAVARLIAAIPGAAVQVGNWPASWSFAEAAGLLMAVAVLAVAGRRRIVDRS